MSWLFHCGELFDKFCNLIFNIASSKVPGCFTQVKPCDSANVPPAARGFAKDGAATMNRLEPRAS
jgi:hypothetical protein